MALDLTAVAVRGRWVKHTYPGSPPLPERDPPPDNRWQRGTAVDALYLADSEETAWAEWYRHLAERAIRPSRRRHTSCGHSRLTLRSPTSLRHEKLAAAGLAPPTPGRPGWHAYQLVGEQLSADGWPGLLAPSAARPAGKILCLFRDGNGVGGAKPSPPPRHVPEPPPPPTGLVT